MTAPTMAWVHRRQSIALIGAAALAVAVIPPLPATAQAEQDADFQAYCRAKHPNSFPERIGFAHVCQQPGASGGATRHNVDLAQACRLTTGSESYRRSGSRVICAASTEEAPGQAATTTSGTLDFQVYCREKFPNSGYERRAESWGVVHYCRRPGATGGFTLQPVDLADACDRAFATRDYEVRDNAVTCGSAGATANEASPSRPGPAPLPRRRPLPEPEPGPVPGPWPEAEPLPLPLPPPGEPGEPEVANLEQEGSDIALACQAIGGRWRSGTLPLVEDILSELDRTLADRYANCDAGSQPQFLEQCRSQAKVENSTGAYFRVHMIWQCHVALVSEPPPAVGIEDIRLARDEGCAIEETLSLLHDTVNSAGGAMPLAHSMLLDRLELDDLCAVGTIKLIRADGTEVETGHDVPLLEPVEVRVAFDRDMKRPRREVEIVTDQGRFRITAVRQGPRLYTGEHPIVFAPASSVQE